MRHPLLSRAWWLVAPLIVMSAAKADAVDVGLVADDPAPLQFHAFASQGYIKSWDNNYLAESAVSRGSFEFTETGINVSKQLTDKLRMGMQLFARKLGTVGNYNIKLDWFYVDYHWRDWLGLRVGRVKIPFGLYNEINDVDSARVSVLMPQSIYNTQNRDYLLAQTGAELYGLIPLDVLGGLEYRLYTGAIYIDRSTITSSSSYTVDDIRIPYVVGGRLMWETPLEGLRLGGSIQDLRVDSHLSIASAQAFVHVPAVLWVLSAEYAYADLLLAAEYSRWHVSLKSDNPDVYPNVDTTVSERAYVMASYRITDWLQPGAYYSVLFPNVDKREGRAQIQNDFAATLRFDVNQYWLVKLEGHYMIGTAALDSSLNDDTPLKQLAKDWAVVLLKTTAYF